MLTAKNADTIVLLNNKGVGDLASTSKKLVNFFSDKTLEIPGYQRDYAWNRRNVDDLLDDVAEALDDSSQHYLGTFILSQDSRSDRVQVVDGQQRLTTLTLVFHALVRRVERDDLRMLYRSQFIESPATGPKLHVQEMNREFFRALTNAEMPQPQTGGHERLSDAYDQIRLRVDVLIHDGGQPRLEAWLKQLSNMEVLEFVAEDEGRAIRMFQSVNDRGVPLSKMDIVKSLLIYNSNRYLKGRLDSFVAEAFGEAFHSFSRLKRLVGQPGFQVTNLRRETFKEDDVLRYHYLTFRAEQFGLVAASDYSATTETVLDDFLKPALKTLRGNEDGLYAFIEGYTRDLVLFFSVLEQELLATRTDTDAYLMWVVQNVSATLHPLIVRLRERDWLSEPGEVVAIGKPRTLRELVEVADIRALKLNMTGPQAGIFKLAGKLDVLSPIEVGTRIKDFSKHFLSDDAMRDTLTTSSMYKNPALVRILVEEERDHLKSAGYPDLNIAKLVSLIQAGITQEHIVAQSADESFRLESYGFEDTEDFREHLDRLGNLTLLETGINAACSNRTVEFKVSQPNLYQSSGYLGARTLAAKLKNAEIGFNKAALQERSAELAARAVARWSV